METNFFDNSSLIQDKASAPSSEVLREFDSLLFSQDTKVAKTHNNERRLFGIK